MTTTTKVTEIERAAATLLSATKVIDPEISEWIARLLSDPEHIEFCPFGHHPNSASYEMKFDWNNPELGGHRDRRVMRLVAQAVCNLAHSLACYRDDGRPDGDMTRSMGDGFSVTTSLAAAIGEFHAAVINAYLTE